MGLVSELKIIFAIASLEQNSFGAGVKLVKSSKLKNRQVLDDSRQMSGWDPCCHRKQKNRLSSKLLNNFRWKWARAQRRDGLEAARAARCSSWWGLSMKEKFWPARVMNQLLSEYRLPVNEFRPKNYLKLFSSRKPKKKLGFQKTWKQTLFLISLVSFDHFLCHSWLGFNIFRLCKLSMEQNIKPTAWFVDIHCLWTANNSNKLSPSVFKMSIHQGTLCTWERLNKITRATVILGLLWRSGGQLMIVTSWVRFLWHLLMRAVCSNWFEVSA